MVDRLSCENVDSRLQRLGPRAQIALIVLAIFCFLLPVLAQVSTYHSDEHYYMDSAVYMAAHQDFLTPYYNDGTVRAKKPIITYWAIIAAQMIFGVNFFAARLPFLLAGCLTIWLTYKISMRLFNHHWSAILAAIVLATNVQFLMLCLRATPDILQTLFLAASLHGFIGIIFHRDLCLGNYLLAYGGAALAVETKGLLGMVPVFFAFGFFMFYRNKTDSIKNIVHIPVMLFSIALALSWYILLFTRHGGGALELFFSDQVAEKMEKPSYAILINLLEYLWGVFRNFLPWSLLLPAAIPLCGQSLGDFLRRHRKEACFVCSWFLLLLLIFIGGSDVRTRYLIPAYPFLSILLAAMLARALQVARFQRLWRWFCVAIVVLTALMGIVLLPLGIILSWRIAVAAVLLIALATGMACSRKNTGKLFSPVLPGLLILMVFVGMRALILPVFEFEPSRALTRCIFSAQSQTHAITVWSQQRYNHTRQIYYLSQGRIQVRYFARKRPPEDLSGPGGKDLVILREKEKHTFLSDHYNIHPCGFIFRAPEPQMLRAALLSGRQESILAAIQEPLYLAVKKAS